LDLYRSNNHEDILKSIQTYQVKTVRGVESTQANLHYGYDRQKLDHIVARLAPFPYTVSTVSSVKAATSPVTINTHSLASPAQTYQISSEKKKQTKFEEPVQKSYCGEIQADSESLVFDNEEPQYEEEKQNQESIEKTKEEEPKAKKVPKRQEVMSARNKGTSPKKEQKQNQREEKPKAQESPVAEAKKNQDKGELMTSPKKVSVRHDYNFGNEQRRGGSNFITNF